MSKRKIEALRQTVTRGATETERKKAQDALGNLKVDHLPAVFSAEEQEERETTYSGTFMLTRTSNGVNGFLRKPAFEHFLKHVKENQVFTYKTVPYVEKSDPRGYTYGSGDFQICRGWMLRMGYVTKVPGGYKLIGNHKQIREAWNNLVENTKLV